MSEQLSLNLNSSGLMKKGTPLLRWTGGKRALLKHIFPILPQTFGNYYEPFLGGGALFFALQPPAATVADKNEELINCYIQVRDHPDEVIATLSRMENSKENYYRVRKSKPRKGVIRAARLIYLITLSFNGIYRENSKGDFNVPYGQRLHLNPCNPQKINAVSRALSDVRIKSEDFEATVADAKEGDLVYFDPPYTVAHGNNGFILYNARIFSWEDQVRLARLAKKLKERGCYVVISNADHPSIFELYEEFKVHKIERSSVMAALKSYRRQTTECLFCSWEPT